MKKESLMTLPDLVRRLPEFNRKAGFPLRVQYLEGLVKVFALIHADISRRYTIDALAKHAGVNRRQLKTLFKIATGNSVLQYLIAIRMQEGERLVRTTDEQISGIALSCGYYTSNSFAEQFRKKFGLNPLEYRKTTREVEHSEHLTRD